MPTTRRPESEIMREIAQTYSGLSPENLHRDGEASRAHVIREGARLRKKLNSLFRELGRKVDEVEAYDKAYRGR